MIPGNFPIRVFTIFTVCTVQDLRISLYDHEYFVHGIIKGLPNSGYRFVLWSELVAKGIGTLIPLDGAFGHMSHLVPESGD